MAKSSERNAHWAPAPTEYQPDGQSQHQKPDAPSSLRLRLGTLVFLRPASFSLRLEGARPGGGRGVAPGGGRPCSPRGPRPAPPPQLPLPRQHLLDEVVHGAHFLVLTGQHHVQVVQPAVHALFELRLLSPCNRKSAVHSPRDHPNHRLPGQVWDLGGGALQEG